MLEKLFDLLREKNWIVLLISMVASFFINTQIDNSIYDNLPFQDKNYNVIAVFIVISLIVFLILYAILAVINKIKSAIKNSQDDEYYSRLKQHEDEETIEKIRDYHDSLSDREYSILIYLIKNNNQKPYIELNNRVDFYSLYNDFLNDRNKFSCSEYHGKETQTEHYKYTLSGKQYLLKDGYYKMLKSIIEKKGSIGHFKRNLVDLGQD